MVSDMKKEKEPHELLSTLFHINLFNSILAILSSFSYVQGEYCINVFSVEVIMSHLFVYVFCYS